MLYRGGFQILAPLRRHSFLNPEVSHNTGAWRVATTETKGRPEEMPSRRVVANGVRRQDT